MYTSAVADADAFLQPTLINFDQGNDSVDLGSVSFVSGATAVVSGNALVVNDGSDFLKIVLSGGIASSYTVAADGDGGSIITPTATAAARLTEVTASFAASGPAGAMTTHSPILMGMPRPSFTATDHQEVGHARVAL